MALKEWKKSSFDDMVDWCSRLEQPTPVCVGPWPQESTAR